MTPASDPRAPPPSHTFYITPSVRIWGGFPEYRLAAAAVMGGVARTLAAVMGGGLARRQK